MSVKLKYFRIKKESLESMLIDNIYIGVVGEYGADQVAFFETEVRGLGGMDGWEEIPTENNDENKG